MITALDSNILIALWIPDHIFNQKANTALDMARKTGALITCPVVYVELLAVPGKSRLWVDEFLQDGSIQVDWQLEEKTWLEAGEAYVAYAERRRKTDPTAPRRIVADFMIGSHAQHQADRLLTTDDWYKTTFKGLRLELVQ